MQHLNKK